MRLLYALILITGFNLPWHWYVIATAVWSVSLIDPAKALARRYLYHHGEDGMRGGPGG